MLFIFLVLSCVSGVSIYFCADSRSESKTAVEEQKNQQQQNNSLSDDTAKQFFSFAEQVDGSVSPKRASMLGCSMHSYSFILQTSMFLQC